MKKTNQVSLPLLNILSILIFLSQSSIAQVKLKPGDNAPDFTATDPSGKQFALKDLRGKIVLLDFWASWCMPCRVANAELVTIYKTFNPNGFEIISISLDGKKEAWEKAIKNDNLYWKYHGSDLKGWENAVAELYGVDAIPASFLIDENGIILYRDLDEYDIEKKLKYIYFDQVNMYPDMVNSKLYFTGKTKYAIWDTKGNLILKDKGEEVDVTGLPQGDYICKYENKSEKFHKRTISLPKVTFYPTSVTDFVTLSREADYEVINQRGKVEVKGKGTSVDMTYLPVGVYYLNLEGDLTRIFKK